MFNASENHQEKTEAGPWKSLESAASLLIGGGLIACGLQRRGLRGGIVAALGAALAAHGLKLHCCTPGEKPAVIEEPAKPSPIDKVEEASMESFPASDAPSFNP